MRGLVCISVLSCEYEFPASNLVLVPIRIQVSKMPELPNQQNFAALEKLGERKPTGPPDPALVGQHKGSQA